MSTRAQTPSSVSLHLQRTLKNIVDTVDVLALDLTDKSLSSKALQRITGVTRIQEEQSTNKSFENAQALNSLVEQLAIPSKQVEDSSRQLQEILNVISEYK